MHLYNVTLQTPASITAAAVGHFSGTKAQQIIVAHNSEIELLVPDANTGRLVSIVTVPVFAHVRSLVSFRLTGSAKDFIVIGSDAGRIVVLEYLPLKNTFVKVIQETFGRTGCRRIVPGQMLAADPRGRAVMIAALEKTKYVYVLNRDSNNAMTVSSPLESSKNSILCFQIVGVDVGFENPCFAAIEVDFQESDTDISGKAFDDIQKMLTYYELDLGLNHVVRKWSGDISATSHHLIPIPGGRDGPSGVIVCSENFLTWMHPDFESVSIPIPTRPQQLDAPNVNGSKQAQGIMVTKSTVHKLKKSFFVLIQTELGDIFKLSLDYATAVDGGIGHVTTIRIRYFETLPLASEICLLKSGFLFHAAEFGDQYLATYVAHYTRLKTWEMMKKTSQNFLVEILISLLACHYYSLNREVSVILCLWTQLALSPH